MTQAVEPLKRTSQTSLSQDGIPWKLRFILQWELPLGQAKLHQVLLAFVVFAIYKLAWTMFWTLPSWIKLVPHPTKNIQYLDSGTSNMDPPKRCWSGNVWKRVPLSNVDNFRSPPWSVENDHRYVFYFGDGRITNHQHKPALHFITGWNLQIIINPYISYFFLEATQRLPQFSNRCSCLVFLLF